MLKQMLTLNNGIRIPQLALGTWLIENDKAAEVIRSALEVGYRHIDTAKTYGNERGIGEGIRASGFARDDLFIASKVAEEEKSYEATSRDIDRALMTMGLDYLDLMIIQSPQPLSLVGQTDDRFFDENIQSYRALEDALAAGKVRAIGVSNFTIDDLENILDACSVVPAVNQVRAHVSCMPFALIDFCNQHGIQTESYSPVAHGEADRIHGIASIAAKYGVTIPQLCIRYVLQQGMIALPKSSNPLHMQENSEVVFQISAADMDILNATSDLSGRTRTSSHLFGSILLD